MGCRLWVSAALCATVIAACGSSGKQNSSQGGPLTPQDTTKALTGSPRPLAALHAQANQLLGGGATAFHARLAVLRGYPVVVNKWASWCGPCQVEFPIFQRVALRFARRVAFIGIDGKDHNSAASAFLRNQPVPYPSYTDPSESIARSMQAAFYYPQTLFIDRGGKVVYDHAGPYQSPFTLASDIQRYALGGG